MLLLNKLLDTKDEKENKVALMTWHHTYNYGTALQAFALSNAIKRLGFEVDLIDYRRKSKVVTFSNDLTGMIKRVVYNFKKANNNFKKRYLQKLDSKKITAFDSFYKDRFSYTVYCKSDEDLNELNKSYQAFVCGSDQIWNPKSLDTKFFLDFVWNPEQMIPYAPSIGVSEIQDSYKEDFITAVQRFRNLSCREIHGSKLISSLIDREVQIVADPVLLFDDKEWIKLLDLPDKKPNKKRPYLLCFLLVNNREQFEYSAELAKRMNLDLRVFSSTQSQKVLQGNIYGAGPVEFIQLVREADYICTDSFHGMIFSTIFGVPFTVFEKFDSENEWSSNSRIYSFLEITDQHSRLYSSSSYTDDIELLRNYSFEVPFNNINELKRNSLQYLNNSLSKAIESQ
jgi:hypothetical protein